jgi:hypothetical protein
LLEHRKKIDFDTEAPSLISANSTISWITTARLTCSDLKKFISVPSVQDIQILQKFKNFRVEWDNVVHTRGVSLPARRVTTIYHSRPGFLDLNGFFATLPMGSG